MRFFFDICHLRVKKPDSGEKKHGKVYSNVITDREAECLRSVSL